MQIVVKRSSLTQRPTPVMATYEDNIVVDAAAHGQGMTVISVPPSAVQNNHDGMVLVDGWRDAGKQKAASTEASRRIDAVFPDYSQRNSMAEISGYILQYGADATKWPTRARDRKTEIDRCWNYVTAVRAKSTAMQQRELPSDPTGDSNWPTAIVPYKP